MRLMFDCGCVFLFLFRFLFSFCGLASFSCCLKHVPKQQQQHRHTFAFEIQIRYCQNASIFDYFRCFLLFNVKIVSFDIHSLCYHGMTLIAIYHLPTPLSFRNICICVIRLFNGTVNASTQRPVQKSKTEIFVRQINIKKLQRKPLQNYFDVTGNDARHQHKFQLKIEVFSRCFSAILSHFNYMLCKYLFR